MEMAIIDTMIFNHRSNININMDTNQMLLKRKEDICSKIFALLQRDEVSNQFSPDKETIDKILT
jgi:hypothetical protein